MQPHTVFAAAAPSSSELTRKPIPNQAAQEYRKTNGPAPVVCELIVGHGVLWQHRTCTPTGHETGLSTQNRNVRFSAK
jgi:hypothetical protein